MTRGWDDNGWRERWRRRHSNPSHHAFLGEVTRECEEDRVSAEETGKEINGCGGVFSIPRRLTRIESRRHALFLARGDSKRAPGIDDEANAWALLHPRIGRGSLQVLGYPNEP